MGYYNVKGTDELQCFIKKSHKIFYTLLMLHKFNYMWEFPLSHRFSIFLNIIFAFALLHSFAVKR